MSLEKFRRKHSDGLLRPGDGTLKRHNPPKAGPRRGGDGAEHR